MPRRFDRESTPITSRRHAPDLHDPCGLPRERCAEADPEFGRVAVDAGTHQSGLQPLRACRCCRSATG